MLCYQSRQLSIVEYVAMTEGEKHALFQKIVFWQLSPFLLLLRFAQFSSLHTSRFSSSVACLLISLFKSLRKA